MQSQKRKPGPARGTRQTRARVARGETKGTPNVPEHIKGNGMRGAFQKGYNAAMAKVSADKNPYPYQATGKTVTYQRGMHRMWYDGWMAAVRHLAGK